MKIYTIFGSFLIVALLFSEEAIAANITWDDGGDGISWNDPANWDNGVPTINDIAIIDDDSVVISTDVSVGGISLYSNLTITSSASLLVFNGSLGLITGKANSINNYGSLAIINGLISIPIDGRFLNRVNSTFSVSGGLNGIVNEGRMINRANADIFISFSTAAGLINRGYFENRGYIEVFQCETGIINESPTSAPEKAQILNKGILQIRMNNEKGFENMGGIIDNEGDLQAYDNGDYSIESSFGNGFTSEMYNRAGASLLVKDGLVAGNKFQNDGMLKVENPGFLAFNSGNHFVNNDTLYISAIEYSGLQGGDTLINSTTGVILADSIKKKLGITSYLISSKGYFRNDGLIDLELEYEVGGIERSSGTSSDVFENFGEILICEIGFGYGIANSQFMVNQVGANITISELSGNFSGISNSDTLINYGDILIHSSSNANGFFQPAVIAYAENEGMIKIENMEGSHGFRIQNGKFVNNGGSIELSNNDLDILIDNRATFFNEASIFGYFNTCISTIVNDGDNTTVAKFQNRGNMDLLSNADATFVNDGDFVNGYCGVLNNLNIIDNRSNGLLINYGRFIHSSKEPILNLGTMVNEGVFYSNFRNVESVFISQTGVYIFSIFGHIENGKTYPIVIVDNSADAEIELQWYSDLNRTVAVADFDSSNVSLHISSNVSGLSRLYFEISGFGNACVNNTYSIEINDLDELSCQFIGTNSFEGSVDNNWFNEANWSGNRLPNYCMDISVPASTSLLLTQDHFGQGNKIEIQTGALFETQSGAVLDIRNGFE